ncbi:hypothetical protein N7G274_008342 [Stereocaulon virgatum]|uniref:Pentatricopeptide repeat-containing protein n=1 Tax=Stereocaulon virgatum TaxID=373712 RepID=A0ABR4A3N9_9LECA
MSTSFICLRCSRQLLRPYARVRNSSFVSLGKLVSNNDNEEQAADETASVCDEPVKVQRQWPKKRLSFAKQYQERRKPSGVDKVLETLFSSNRLQEEAPQRSRYSRTPKEQQIDGENRVEPTSYEKSVDHRLQELRMQLQEGTLSTEDIWTSCQELLNQKLWKPSREGQSNGEDAIKVYLVFRDILLAICSKQRLTIDDVITTPADVIRIYKQHGVMRYWWHKVLWAQIAQILRLKYQNKDETSNEGAPIKIQTVLRELLDVWNLFLQRYDAIPSSMSVHRNVPEPSLNASKTPWLSPNITSRFLRLVPKHPPGAHARLISPAALLTLDLMESEDVYTAPALSQFFKRLREGGRMDRRFAIRCLAEADVPSDMIDQALANWGHLPAEAVTRVAIRRQQQGLPQLDMLDWNVRSLSKRLTEIDHAYEREDAEEVIKLWQSFQNYLKTHEDAEVGERVFSRLIRVFFALRRQDQALEVWNVMISTGRTPMLIHWNAMLAGCVADRDTQSMQDIWSNMLRSGVKPDNRAWTTYIHGLIKCNRVQEGFVALEELGRTWKAAAAAGPPSANDEQGEQTEESKKDRYGPDMEPVHAALTALVTIQRFDLTQSVIRWAKSHSLRLQTYTFNILLRPIVRTGTQAQVESHLAQMQAHACAPDVVTFTIILNGLTSNPDSHFHFLTPTEQENTISTFLADMEAQNITPSAKTYSTLLDGLTGKTNPGKEKTVNVPAARMILAHMAARNIPPSPHIYTILVTHYFSTQPPDYPAINSLLENIRGSNTWPALDSIFYDRMIEGYVYNGEIEKALSWLRRVPEEGKTPGFIALYQVLRSLAEREEWELAAELVRNAEDAGPKGLFRHGVGSWRGKSSFWGLVDELRERGVVDGPVSTEAEGKVR